MEQAMMIKNKLRNHIVKKLNISPPNRDIVIELDKNSQYIQLPLYKRGCGLTTTLNIDGICHKLLGKKILYVGNHFNNKERNRWHRIADDVLGINSLSTETLNIGNDLYGLEPDIIYMDDDCINNCQTNYQNWLSQLSCYFRGHVKYIIAAKRLR